MVGSLSVASRLRRDSPDEPRAGLNQHCNSRFRHVSLLVMDGPKAASAYETVVSFELRVEALMPLIVAGTVISFLCRRTFTQKH
jgi:hypothetical protein